MLRINTKQLNLHPDLRGPISSHTGPTRVEQLLSELNSIVRATQKLLPFCNTDHARPLKTDPLQSLKDALKMNVEPIYENNLPHKCKICDHSYHIKGTMEKHIEPVHDNNLP